MLKFNFFIQQYLYISNNYTEQPTTNRPGPTALTISNRGNNRGQQQHKEKFQTTTTNNLPSRAYRIDHQ